MAEEEDKKRKIDEIDERSDQVKEILGKAPNWVIRWGITVIFIIVILLVIGAALISYNDILPSRVIITSKNPPVYLDAKASGRLTNVFVESDEDVKEGAVLAEIENTADFDDVYLLKRKIEDFIPSIRDLDTLRLEFPSFLKLGPIQLQYANFITQYQGYILYNSLQPNQKESRVISSQISTQQQLLRNQEIQLRNFEEQLKLSKKTFERQAQLFEKGVISRSEYEDADRAYIADRSQYEDVKSRISNTRIAIATNNSSLTRNDIEGQQSTNTNRQSLELAYQNLNNSILEWEQQFILKSPIDGKITIFDIWTENQSVRAGEILFTIVPDNYERLVAKLNVPIQNSGKVEVGQRVIIKLDNYPNQEWGSLEGKIVSISDVPKRGEQLAEYTIYVDIIGGLTTSYNKEIEFKQEMQGTAEIVLEELTILERVFYQIRSILDE